MLLDTHDRTFAKCRIKKRKVNKCYEFGHIRSVANDLKAHLNIDLSGTGVALNPKVCIQSPNVFTSFLTKTVKYEG
jgi:hypothetical protein